MITKGEKLEMVMQIECNPEMIKADSKASKELKEFAEKEPSFEESYKVGILR